MSYYSKGSISPQSPSLHDSVSKDNSSGEMSVLCEKSTLFESIADTGMLMPFEDIFIIKDVYIDTRNKPLDITIEGGYHLCDPLRISNMQPDSPWSDLLREKDYLLSVNDIPLCLMGQPQVWETIKMCGPDLCFDIRRKFDYSSLVRINFLIEMPAKGLVYGLYLSSVLNWKTFNEENQLYGLFVVKVDGESPYVGLLQTGDIISAVDGVAVSSSCAESIKSHLVKCRGGLLDLIVYRNKSAIRPGSLLYFYNPIFRVSGDDFVSDSMIKVYRMVKKDGFFGINVVGGCRDYPIFVAGVDKGSVAESFNLFVGDQLLKINDLEVSLMEQSDFVRLIKNFQQVVLVTVHNLSGLRRFIEYVEHFSKFRTFSSRPSSAYQSNIIGFPVEKRREFIARALVDFDASTEKRLPFQGLSFRFGDLLHVHNGSDLEWWRAEKLDHSGNRLAPPLIGIVPSEEMMFIRRSKQKKQVHFTCPSTLVRRKLTFSFRKSSETNSISLEPPICRSFGDFPAIYEKKVPIDVPPYDIVQKLPLTGPRPVILLTLLKEHIIDLLVSSDVSLLELCPIQTNREDSVTDSPRFLPKVFVPHSEMVFRYNQKKYIDFYSNGLTLNGTCLDDIARTSASGKHCLLNVSHLAIKQLLSHNIHPIVILLKLLSIDVLQKFPSISTERAVIQHRNLELFEKRCPNLITDIVQVNGYEEIVPVITRIVEKHQSDHVWISTRDEWLNG